MATASTKSQARKQKSQRGKREQFVEPDRTDAPVASHIETGRELSPRVWWVAYAAVLLVAAFVRIYQLELRPMHHDEGVNGFFLMNLIRTGIFRYDPSNYHGPTLFYFTWPLASAAQHFQMLGTWVVRIVPVIFGVATVWLALGLRRYIGAVGALAAGALLALSPGFIFFSRYFIHEMMFVFFTLGIVTALLRFYESNQAFYVGLAALSAALLFATKETAFISAGVLLIAWAMAWGYMAFVREQGWFSPGGAAASKGGRIRPGGKGSGAQQATSAAQTGGLVARFGGWPRIAILSGVALGIFLFVNVLFYSSFFTNAKGVTDSLKAFDIWTKTGRSTFHGKPFYTYVNWLWQEESPLLLLAVVGAFIALWQMRNRFALFTALWGFGLLAAYSLINYKTPWLTLSMLVPFALAGGYAINTIYRTGGGRDRIWRVVALVALGSGLVICAYQSYMLNLVHYDDDRYIYVYAHTKREYLDLIKQIDETAARIGTKYDTSINVAAPEYWPMPWYLRDYKSVGYAGRMPAATTNDALIIASTTQSAEMQAKHGARYQVIGTYPMRPGVTLALYARRDLIRP